MGFVLIFDRGMTYKFAMINRALPPYAELSDRQQKAIDWYLSTQVNFQELDESQINNARDRIARGRGDLLNLVINRYDYYHQRENAAESALKIGIDITKPTYDELSDVQRAAINWAVRERLKDSGAAGFYDENSRKGVRDAIARGVNSALERVVESHARAAQR